MEQRESNSASGGSEQLQDEEKFSPNEDSSTKETEPDDHRAARETLGREIRRVRKAQGKTLTDIAGQAGVSTSLLSQIETGRVDPSLDSLRDIAEALGTAPFKLLAEQPIESGLVRAGEGRQLSLPATDVDIQLLSPSMHGPFEVIKWTLKVGGATARAPRGHEGVETTVILRGHVRIEAGEKEFILDPGDAFTAQATIPHRTVNLGDEPAVGISVISPPSF